jgi:hypothetical protein
MDYWRLNGSAKSRASTGQRAAAFARDGNSLEFMAFLSGALTDPVSFGPFLALGLLITFVLRQRGLDRLTPAVTLTQHRLQVGGPLKNPRVPGLDARLPGRIGAGLRQAQYHGLLLALQRDLAAMNRTQLPALSFLADFQAQRRLGGLIDKNSESLIAAGNGA